MVNGVNELILANSQVENTKLQYNFTHVIVVSCAIKINKHQKGLASSLILFIHRCTYSISFNVSL